MAFLKFNYREELEKLTTCETPCAVCRGRLAGLTAANLLEIIKAADRQERRIRRARRAGNLITFPKLT